MHLHVYTIKIKPVLILQLGPKVGGLGGASVDRKFIYSR